VRFVLHYRGPLRANARPDHKHELRRAFHTQLITVWSQSPLSETDPWTSPERVAGHYHFRRNVGPYVFVPLVTDEVNAVAELKLTLLRPEPPGGLVTQGGDIDNRMKTLLDALSVPSHENALPQSEEARLEPIYCLLAVCRT